MSTKLMIGLTVVVVVVSAAIVAYFLISGSVEYSELEINIVPDSIRVDSDSVDLSAGVTPNSVPVNSILSIVSDGSNSYSDSINISLIPFEIKELSFSYGGLNKENLVTITLIPFSNGTRGKSSLGKISTVYNLKTNETEFVSTDRLYKSPELKKFVKSGGGGSGVGSGGGASSSSGGSAGSSGGLPSNTGGNASSGNVSAGNVSGNNTVPSGNVNITNGTTQNNTSNVNVTIPSNITAPSNVTNVSGDQTTVVNATQNNTIPIVTNQTPIVSKVINGTTTLIVTAGKDSALTAGDGNSAYYERGSTPDFDYRFNARVGFYWFDLSSIPKDAVIKNATLKLYSVDFNTFDIAGNVPIYLANTLKPHDAVNWVEGNGISYYAQYGGTSWRAKLDNTPPVGTRKTPNKAWSNNKGRFKKGDLFSAYFSSSVGQMKFVRSLGVQDSTDLSEAVKQIVNNSYQYEGLAIDMKGLQGKIRKDKIAAREYSDASKRPQLQVVYTKVVNQTSSISNSNLTIFDVNIGQEIRVREGEPFGIRINQGDVIAVKFVRRENDTAVLQFTTIQTTETQINIEEEHTIVITNLGNGSIEVTVHSEVVTKQIGEGETQIFSFGNDNAGVQIRECICPSGNASNCFGDNQTVQLCNLGCVEDWQCTGWGDCLLGTSNRLCFDINNCGTILSKPLISQTCSLYSFNVDYYPKELNLVVRNGTAINFNVSVQADQKSILVKWFLGGNVTKTDSSQSVLNSFFFALFTKDDLVSADVSTNVDSRIIPWNVKVLNGGPCTENWQCLWTNCSKEDEFSYAYACEDLNSCGTNLMKPYRNSCGDASVWDCGDWSTCFADYSLGDLVKNEFQPIKGSRERLCKDLKGGRSDRIEKQTCDVSSSVNARKVLWCQEEYVEIYDNQTLELVSRIKETELKNINRVDVTFIATQFVGYCNYCYDGIKNFDETKLDCGGPSCPVCIEYEPIFDYINIVKWSLWILLLLLLLLLLFLRRKEEKNKPLKKVSKMDKIEKGLDKFEARVDNRIKSFFKNLFRSSKSHEVRKYEHKEHKHGKNFVVRFFEAIGSGIEEFFKKIKSRKTHVEKEQRVEREVKKPVERVERVVVIKKERGPSRFAMILRKLRGWRKKQYYDAERLEPRVKVEDSHFKRIVRKVKTAYVVRKVKRQKKKEIKRTLKEIRKVEKVTKKAEKVKQKKQVKAEKGLGKSQLRGLLGKLKVWKKQGYYDAEKVERKVKEDLKKHKKGSK